MTFPLTIKLTLGTIFIIITLTLWILHLHYNDPLWSASMQLSYSISSTSSLSFIFWLSRYPLSDISYALPSIIQLYSSRKASALRSMSLLCTSLWLKQMLRCIFRQPRPMFEDGLDYFKSKCMCSLGFPSGHAEGGVLVYSIMLFEFVYSRRGCDRRYKICATIVALIIMTSIVVASLYYGIHSVMQIAVGLWIGILMLSLGYLLRRPLDRLFERVLSGDIAASLQVTGFFFCLWLTSNFLWLSWLSDDMKYLGTYKPLKCKFCFFDNAYRIRLATAKEFQNTIFYSAYFFGLWIYKPARFDKHTNDRLNLTCHTLRIIVACICNLPNMLLKLHFNDIYTSMIWNAVINVITGLMITCVFNVLDIQINGRFGDWNMRLDNIDDLLLADVECNRNEYAILVKHKRQ